MSLVTLTVKDGLGEILLNRADKMNAFSGAMMADFLQTLDQVEASIASDTVRVVAIRSAAAPKAFCAGADLGERIAMNEAQVSDTLRTQRSVMDRVAALAVPTIAVIDGIAFGGGLELALACDLRVVAQSALVGLTETKLAIIPGAGGTQRLRAIVGEAKAKELILLGKRLDAEEALKLGVVHAVDASPTDVASKWVQELLACGPLALRAAKKAIEAYRSDDFSAQLDAERACYESVLHSEDRLEGLKAFSEKRIPKYQGR